MKKYVKSFLLRGAVFAGLGPVVLAVIYAIVAENIEVSDVCLGIFSTYLLAFFVAGMSVVYTVEHLPLLAATFIHSLSLFASYLAVYLLNGWIAPSELWIFVCVFIPSYAVVWLFIWLGIRSSVKKLNERMK